MYTLHMTRLGLLIGEVARRAGVSVDTIRYYEKRRLVPVAPRSDGGYRLFTPEAVSRVQFIKEAQEMGLSLDDIKALLTGGGQSECRGMRDLLRKKLTEIDQRAKALAEFRNKLARHLRTCEDELAENGAAAKCPVIVEITRSNRARSQR